MKLKNVTNVDWPVKIIFEMNLTRRFFRVSHLCDFFFRNYSVSGTKSAVFVGKSTSISVKSFSCKFPQSYSKISSLDNEVTVIPKKRLIKKKKYTRNEIGEGLQIAAFSTAEEYNLEHLSTALPRFTKYETSTFGYDFRSTTDVVHATRNSETDSECQDIFFFREGCVVLWNFQDSEINSILNFLKQYEDSRFEDKLIRNESEFMNYSISEDVPRSQIQKDCVMLSAEGDKLLEKYAVSNAMALSVHLGAYEANLEQYIQTMAPVTEDLKAGHKIKMSRNEVLQKTGQLFALRHNINLSSDLLDTPDFYWDREELESLYQAIFNYYCINKRTKVINERINHCIELVDLLSSHLNDKHHVRLEWMIIVLIMVEVAFEVCHYLDRYMESQEKNSYWRESRKEFLFKNALSGRVCLSPTLR